MDNSKRNVHGSGPLSILLQSGQVQKVTDDQNGISESEARSRPSSSRLGSIHFKTQSGVSFLERELVYVEPNECEPWEYANRHEQEMGDIEALMVSIKESQQLQPALIRIHPKPHGDIKYQVICGRRRHLACFKLDTPFLAIIKELSDPDAVAAQDAENKLRNDVSNYSNAKLYQKLLLDGVFKSEKELSQKLMLSPSSFNDLMAYAKIPDEIVKEIPSIHNLSKNIALKMVALLNKDARNHAKLLAISNEIGKSITSPAKLESSIEKPQNANKKSNPTKLYKSESGKKLFTFMVDHRGAPSVVINKEIAQFIDVNRICEFLCTHLENELSKSGAPD